MSNYPHVQSILYNKIFSLSRKILIFLQKINGIIKLRKTKNKKGVIPLERTTEESKLL